RQRLWPSIPLWRPRPKPSRRGSQAGSTPTNRRRPRAAARDGTSLHRCVRDVQGSLAWIGLLGRNYTTGQPFWLPGAVTVFGIWMSDENQLPAAGETACPTYFAKRLIQRGWGRRFRGTCKISRTGRRDGGLLVLLNQCSCDFHANWSRLRRLRTHPWQASPEVGISAWLCRVRQEPRSSPAAGPGPIAGSGPQ